MPFYEFIYKNEIIEKFFSMSERPNHIIKNGKTYTYKPTFGGNFILKGRGWASKGTALAPKPRHGKEVGVKIDQRMKNQK